MKKLSKNQFWTLFSCAIATNGQDNPFPIFKKYHKPHRWPDENRCVTVDHESTLKSLLGNGWIESRGEKTYEVRTAGCSLDLVVETYGVTDSGLMILRSTADAAGWDLDKSISAGEVKVLEVLPEFLKKIRPAR